MERVESASEATGPASGEEPIAVAPIVERSPADRFMRRLLGLSVDGPPTSIFAANNAFSQSIAISATRCLITYIAIPFVLPLLNLSSRIGPVVSLLLGFASAIAIVVATRRFFGADHKWRWGYATFGGVVLLWVIFQSGVDISHLVG